MDKGNDMADKITSRPATDKYREEYDRIFKKDVFKSNPGTKGPVNKAPINDPQYGIVQYVGDSGPKISTESADSDIAHPIAEDGSEPSSK